MSSENGEKQFNTYSAKDGNTYTIEVAVYTCGKCGTRVTIDDKYCPNTGCRRRIFWGNIVQRVDSPKK